MSHKNPKFRLVYQVIWRGYNAIEDTWVREEDLANALDLLGACQLRHGI